MLKVLDLYSSYGAIVALKGVSFEVPHGSVVALVGANGAGKSTTLNTVSGLLKPDSGSIRLEDRDIAGSHADKVTAQGLVTGSGRKTDFRRINSGGESAPWRLHSQRFGNR